MDARQLEAYLERIGLHEAPEASVDGLEQMQRAHLETVPFENIDIIKGRVPLALDEDALFDKIVSRRRGGICYELNLLFAEALRALGFNLEIRGGIHPKYGDDMDHLLLVVEAPDGGAPLVADVGFAYNFARPLRLEVGVEQNDGRDRYRLEPALEHGDGYVRIVRIAGMAGEGAESELFSFGPNSCTAADCRARCDWLCVSPESRFTQGPLVCLDAAAGRQTLSANHLITTCGAERTVVDIVSNEQYESILARMIG